MSIGEQISAIDEDFTLRREEYNVERGSILLDVSTNYIFLRGLFKALFSITAIDLKTADDSQEKSCQEDEQLWISISYIEQSHYSRDEGPTKLSCLCKICITDIPQFPNGHKNERWQGIILGVLLEKCIGFNQRNGGLLRLCIDVVDKPDQWESLKWTSPEGLPNQESRSGESDAVFNLRVHFPEMTFSLREEFVMYLATTYGDCIDVEVIYLASLKTLERFVSALRADLYEIKIPLKRTKDSEDSLLIRNGDMELSAELFSDKVEIKGRDNYESR